MPYLQGMVALRLHYTFFPQNALHDNQATVVTLDRVFVNRFT